MTDEIRNSIVKRYATKRGTPSSDDYNAFVDEVSRAATTLINTYNTYILPILNGLPSRENNTPNLGSTTPEDSLDIDAVVHGLDGANMFTDRNAELGSTDPLTGAEYDESLLSGNRASTVKETFQFFKEQIDSLFEDINSLRTLITNESSTTPTTSIERGSLQTIINNINQIANDFYTDGSARLNGTGTKTRTTDLEATILSTDTNITALDTQLNTTGLSDSHIKTDAAISGSKISIDALAENTSTIVSLQDALDKLATGLSRISHGTSSFSSWFDIPTITDTGNGLPAETPQSLKDHINMVGHGGSGGVVSYRAHGNKPADFFEIDDVTSWSDRGLNPNLRNQFLRDDVEMSLDSEDVYIEYTYDILDRISTEKYYTDSTKSILWREHTYSYVDDSGNFEDIYQVVIVDYRDSLRIPLASERTFTVTYTYDEYGRLTSIDRVES